jgi:iron-sulfur cluster assembly protein
VIELTEAAAKQILASAREGQVEGMGLRIAVRETPEGEFDYAMGFDEPAEQDLQVVSLGVTLLVAPSSQVLLQGARVDYVELSPGEFHFIFLNPNDPSYTPPDRSGGDVA